MKIFIETIEALILLLFTGIATFLIAGGFPIFAVLLLLWPVIFLVLVLIYFLVLKKNWPTTDHFSVVDIGTLIFAVFFLGFFALIKILNLK